MSLRQQNLGSFIKPGFNPLAAPTPSYLYNLFTWGNNAYGQLGLGNQTSYSSPKQVGSNNWVTVTANGNSSSRCAFAIKTDGTLWAWGYNNYGQLGQGNTTNYSSPKQVGALTTWSKISCGAAAAFGVKTDGTLWAWGGDPNSFGILGLGSVAISYSSPKQVGALTNWSSVAVGFRTAMATKTDGTLWIWGNNYFGGLGFNSATNYSISSPQQLGALTNWLKISAGYGSNFAIKTDGTLWAWGYNSAGSGVLGLGTTTYKYLSPTQVGALTTWSNIKTASSNPGYSLAIKTDSTLWCWGNNANGNLGLGNVTNYSSPTQVGSLSTWSSVGAGPYSSYAIKTDGTLWSWGYNVFGELGLGTSGNYYSSPKQVGSVTTWNSVFASYNSAIALG